MALAIKCQFKNTELCQKIKMNKSEHKFTKNVPGTTKQK